MPQNCAAVLHRRAGRRRATPSTTCRTTGSSTSSAIFVPGHDAHRRPRPRRRRRPRHLRGPLAGRRPGGEDPRGRGRAAAGHQRLAVRARQGRHPAGAGPRGGPPRPAAPLAYLNMVGGQDELVFDGDSVVVDVRGEVLARGAAVRARTCSSSTSTSPPSTVDPTRHRRRACPRHVTSARPARRRTRRCRPPCPPRLDDIGEVYARAAPRAAGLRAQERLPHGRSSACPAASTRRSWRPSPRDALGGATSSASRCRASTPASTAGTTPPSWPSGIGADYRVQPIAPMVDAFLDQLGLTGVAEENLQARVRGVILMGLSNQRGPPRAGDQQQERARRSATRRSTATASAGSPRSRTSRRRWSGSSPAGATPRPLRRGETPPIPEARSSSRRRPSCGPGQTDQDTLPPYDVLDADPRGATSSGPMGRSRADRRRVRRGRRRPGRDDWSTARSGSAASSRPAQDLAAGVRPGPPAADDQPVAGARVLTVTGRSRRTRKEVGMSEQTASPPRPSRPRRTAAGPPLPAGPGSGRPRGGCGSRSCAR